MNLYQKLQECRVKLQNSSLKKSGENKYAGFKYYELGDFLPTVNSIFKENGLSSLFSVSSDMATLTVVNSEKPEEREIFTTPTADATVKGMLPIQALGSIHTYLRRYLYMNALEIVESDVVDSLSNDQKQAVDKKVVQPTQPKTATFNATAEIQKLIQHYDKDFVVSVAKELAINSATATKQDIDKLSEALFNKSTGGK